MIAAMEKSEDAFRTISEAAEDLNVPQHVLRFWETRFTQIRPMKRGGGRRYSRPADMALLHAIRSLLYGEGYTIKGVQRILKEQGAKAVIAGAATPGSMPPTAADMDSSQPEAGVAADMTALRAALADLDAAHRALLAARLD